MSLESLFPSVARIVVATPEMWTAPLHPEEEPGVAGAVPRRRRQFTAGRSCAREALRQLGITGVALPNGDDRQPRWPNGVTGSITHCADFAAAVVARQSEFRGIGIDAELRGRSTAELADRICTPAELVRLTGLADGAPWVLLVFSAKESVYKCLHPITGIYLGFRDVEIDFRPAGDSHGGSFGTRIVRGALAGGAATGPSGRFVVTDRHVVTGAWLLPRARRNSGEASVL